MIQLDGSYGESGGGMFRQALGLSMYTGKAFHMTKIRQGRPKPGLSMQHLTALNAAHQICDAQVSGNKIGSREVTFTPGKLKGGKYIFDIGTAGSITLLLQALLLPCCLSQEKIKFTITGGTDVAWSIPSDYFARVLIPQLRRYANIDFKVSKRGYYPKGKGQVEVSIQGKGTQTPITLTEQGEIFKVWGISHASQELQGVAERQAEAARIALSGLKVPIDLIVSYAQTQSIGSGITLWAVCGDKHKGLSPTNPIIIGGDCLGKQELKAETVGTKAAQKLLSELRSGAACDEYLTDQLLPFIGICGGKLKTSTITDHSTSNMYVAEQFLGKVYTVEEHTISAQPQAEQDAN